MKPLESLQGRQAIRSIRMEGRVFEGALLKFMYVYRQAAIAHVRVAVIVRKGSGTAVYRNRIKRRIREACRVIVTGSALKPGDTPSAISILITCRVSLQRPVQEVSFESVKNDVVRFVASLPTFAVNR